MPKSARMGTKAKPSAAYRRRLCCFEQRSLGCARFLAKRRSWSFRAGQTKRAIVFVVIHFAGSNRLSYSRLSYVLQPISALDVTSTGHTSVCCILHCVSRHSRRHCRTCHALGSVDIAHVSSGLYRRGNTARHYYLFRVGGAAVRGVGCTRLQSGERPKPVHTVGHPYSFGLCYDTKRRGGSDHWLVCALKCGRVLDQGSRRATHLFTTSPPSLGNIGRLKRDRNASWSGT